MFEETLTLIDQVSGPAEKMAKSVEGLGSTVQNLARGNIDGATSSLQGMASGLDAVMPGLGMLTSIALGAAGAIAGLVAAGAAFALQAAEQKRQLITTYDALLGYAGAGQQADEMLSNLSRSLPQTKDQLAAWGQQFAAMGVTDLSALQGQLTATASAQALMGDKGAAAYTSLSKKIQEAILAHQGLKISDRQLQSLAATGVNVADVAKQMGITTEKLRQGLEKGTISADKFGTALQQSLTTKGQKPLEAMSQSMGSQLAHLKQNFGDMFEDVDPSPFLGAMKDLLSIFDQNTASGRTMKAAVTGFFNGVFAIASKVLPYLKRFFLDLVIAGLKIYISLKPSIAAFKQLFAGKGAGDIFAGMLKSIVFQVEVIGYMVSAAIATFVKMLTIGKAVASGVADAFSSVADIVKGFIDGLVNGLTGGIGRVVDAAKGLAKGAMDAVKGVLGISSPSKVMMQLGGHTAAGFAGGMDAGAPMIKQSAYGMGDAATAGAGKSGSAGGASRANINVSVVIEGAGKSAMEITEEMVATVFERLVLEVGL